MIEKELAFALIGLSFVGGFCFGTAVAKFILRNIIKRHDLVFGKDNNPFTEIL